MKPLLVAATLAAQLGAGALAQTPTPMTYANSFDAPLAGRYTQREADWRNGAIVYQVLVDRFAPSANLAAKRALYPAPKTLRGWTEEPRRGRYLEAEKLWSHEIDFWGGDLASTTARLDHVQQLGAEVLYLNPIVLAYTNHKYDALDYQQISPEYGTRDDLRRLAAEARARGLKLVLDGVFNHMGRNAPRYRAAEAEREGRVPAAGEAGSKDWFVFGPQYQGGTRTWWNAQNLPELNLELPAVRQHLWGAPDSVVRSYLRDGADGWRLDVAFDIGFRYLDELTRAAHAEKPGSLVLGEIPNYPREWFPSVDGVMHFGLRKLLIALANGTLDAPAFQRMTARMLRDADYEHLLKSWLYLDNHDTFRVATTIPDAKARRLAQVLMFTLPGAVNLYYGSEVGMEGGDDPEMRGPMRWDRVAAQHPDLAWTRQLTALRKAHRALRVGDFRSAEASGNVLAFERHTDRATDTVLVIANPGKTAIDTTVMVANSKLMDGDNLVDQLSGQVVNLQAGMVMASLPPQTVWVLKPQPSTAGGYSNYKRVQ
ncbi:alpha-amylase family glycosyl hydrolase [Aquabacterium sp. OR-4]|uniref:alpha-amylase family glycosyl hydrolase n=1 Tax=Aquabacterium sp. OR-4 TaxID=2978127 RepID=UPI0021B1AA64|nr:alpha-amylase family glycosyl hydrolase [Aquabacterium sp. OR-4]MDT7834211.1 alpha-amylase family glycosyl hydrolase [Aquabacterium sp. OR-4]